MYNQTYKPNNGEINFDNSLNINILKNNQFDYDKVNQYIDSKSNGEKDHFSFVNDLLKTKKN
jgi:hypothetical protein